MSKVVGLREPLERKHIILISMVMSVGSAILDLHLTDYSRGSVLTEKGRSFWLTDGRRVDLETISGGGFIGSLTNEPDGNRPDPL